MTEHPGDATLDGLVLAEDRAYVSSLPASAERDAITTTLSRYRAPERLSTGDPLPSVEVHRADSDLSLVSVEALVRDRPVLLAFGSFT